MTNLKSPFLAFILLPLSISGCKEKQKAPSPPVDDAAPAPIDARPVKMTTPKERPPHFTFLSAAKDSMLFADLVGTKDSLRWVSELSEKPQAQSWIPHIENQRALATLALESDDVDLISGTVAKLGQSCGSCHTELKVTPTITVKEPKHRGLDFKDHMAGHKWALDKMWAGLATPSDEQWREGAELLADSPTHLRNLSEYGDDADRAMDLAIEVHGLAAKATKTTDTAERVALFGTFLAACAKCHELPGSAPKARGGQPAQ